MSVNPTVGGQIDMQEILRTAIGHRDPKGHGLRGGNVQF